MYDQSLNDIIDDMRRVYRIPTHNSFEVVLSFLFGWIFNIKLRRSVIYEINENSIFIGIERRKKPRMIEVIKYHLQPKTEIIQTLESK